MTNNPVSRPSRRAAGGAALVACGLLLAAAAPAPQPVATPPAAPVGYPFEGTWIRADRPCMPHATLVRTYTPRDVTSSRSHCAIRRIVANSATFELLEDCHRNPPKVTETIRMFSPDLMALKRQVVRLKIPRAIRYARCTAAAPGSGRPH